MLTDAPCVPAAFLCSSDSTYQACVAACEAPESCQDGMLGPLDPEQCQVLGEGCVCSEGTILHRRHSALCIPEEKCGRFLTSRGGTLQAGFALGPPAPSCTRGLYPSGSALGWSLSQGGSNLGQSGSPHSPESPMPPPTPTAACTDSTGVPRALGETWNSSLSGCCQHQCQAQDTIVPVDLDCPGPRPETCPRFGEVALLRPTEDPCCLGAVCGESHCSLPWALTLRQLKGSSSDPDG